MPEIGFLIYRRFIVDHCHFFHANCELTGLKAAGLLTDTIAAGLKNGIQPTGGRSPNPPPHRVLLPT